MPRPRPKKPAHLEVIGLAPLPPALDEWERALIEPVLARLFDAPRAPTTEPKEVRDGEGARCFPETAQSDEQREQAVRPIPLGEISLRGSGPVAGSAPSAW